MSHYKIPWRTLEIFIIFSSLIIVVSSSFHFVESKNYPWVEERGNSYNTGFVEGYGLIKKPIVTNNISENSGVSSSPIVIDLNHDGYNEVIYTTWNGTLFIRNSIDERIIFSYNFKSVLCNSPIVFDINNDNNLDIIIVSSSDLGSWLYELFGPDYSIAQKKYFPFDNITYAGKIADIDHDRRPELILCTFNGYIYSFDIQLFSIDWQIFLCKGLRNPVAIFYENGSARITVTSGLIWRDWTPYGSTSLYIIDGYNGEVLWTFNSTKIITTPPIIIEVDPLKKNILLAFGTVTGSVYIIDYSSKSVLLRFNSSQFKKEFEWSFFSYVNQTVCGRNILVLQGISGCCGVDIDEARFLWEEYYDYPTTMIDSMCCDIDNDNEIEIVLLHETFPQETSSFTIKNIFNGLNESSFQIIPKHSKGLVIADFNNDTYLEVIVWSEMALTFVDKKDSIDIHGLLLDGHPIYNNSEKILYAMYSNYSLEFIISLSEAIDYINVIQLVIQSNDFESRVLYYPRTHYVNVDSWSIIVNNISFRSVNNKWNIKIDFYINWSFPNEQHQNLIFSIEYLNGYRKEMKYQHIFRIEKDLTISGVLSLYQQDIQVKNDTWLLSSHLLNGSGLSVTYENASDKLVSEEYYHLTLIYNGQKIPLETNNNSIYFSLNLTRLTTGKYSIWLMFDLYPKNSTVPSFRFEILVDSDPVIIRDVIPKPIYWFSSDEITLGVISTDGNGSGLDYNSVEVKVNYLSIFNNSDIWYDFQGAISLNDSIFLYRKIKFENGIYLFQWRIKDIAGNLFTYSIIKEIRIDTISVKFYNPFPLDWQNNTQIDVGIYIYIKSNLSIPSFQIQYNFEYGPILTEKWMPTPSKTMNNEIIKISIPLKLKEGRNNFIKWRLCINDTLSYYSDAFQILIDTEPPYIGVVIPDLNLTYDLGDFEIYLDIIDIVSGINESSIQFQYSKDSKNFSEHWIIPKIEYFSDYRRITIQFEELTGKSNYFRIRMSDLAGNYYFGKDVFSIKINERPIIRNVFPANNSRYEPNESIAFSVNCSDPDPLDIITIEWFSDSDGLIGIGEQFSISNLSLGRHEIHLQINDNHGHVLDKYFIIHVQNPVDEPPLILRLPLSNYLIGLLIIISVIISCVLFYIKKT